LETDVSAEGGLYGQLDSEAQRKLDKIIAVQQEASVHGLKVIEGPGKLSEDKAFKELLNENYIVNIFNFATIFATNLLKINDN
jgi:DNA-nicking Smr family endonuclease